VLNSSGSLAVQGAGSAGLPGLSSTGSTSGSFYDWGVVLALRQPLFDGGATSSAIEGARQQTRLSAIALEQARQAIVLSVQTWWAQHQAAQVQIEAGRAAVRAAELASRDAQLRYRASIAPILEVLIAQRDLQAAAFPPWPWRPSAGTSAAPVCRRIRGIGLVGRPALGRHERWSRRRSSGHREPPSPGPIAVSPMSPERREPAPPTALVQPAALAAPSLWQRKGPWLPPKLRIGWCW
jgi:hypothetical protein